MLAIHYCISGFTQHNGRANGLLDLAEKLIASGHNAHARTRVYYRAWRGNWTHEAEHAALLAKHYEEPVRVNIYAYSWGAGWGAMQLARALLARGIFVQTMVLSDPVFRHPLPWRRWLTLFRRDSRFGLLPAPVIRVPRNVGEVYSFHQLVDWPQGHRLLPDNGATMHPPRRLHRGHAAMDEAPEFHKCAIVAAEQLRAEAIDHTNNPQRAA